MVKVIRLSETEEFKLGTYAYLIGLKRSDNMYTKPEAAQRWLAGWDEAWLNDK